MYFKPCKALTYLNSFTDKVRSMDKMQELRGEIRQLLNDTLVFAAANRNDFEIEDYAAVKATIYREVLDLIAKVDN